MLIIKFFSLHFWKTLFLRRNKVNRYIFSIGLIPVQSFISEARRLRDLKAGSAMLSWFMARGLARLEKAAREFNLIIPHGNAFQELADLKIIEVLSKPRYSLPNRASGYLTLPQKINVEETFIKVLQNGLQDDWEQIFKTAFNGSRPHPFVGIQLTQEEESQLQNDFSIPPTCPLKFIWVVRLAEEDTDLSIDLQRIDRLYEAVKTARPIPERTGKPLYTCSQCGVREEYAPVHSFDEAIAWWNKVRQSIHFQKGYRVKTGENLCKVCLTKRLVSYQEGIEHAFKSTSAIAASTWVIEVTHLAQQHNSSILQTSLQTSLRSYQDLLNQIAEKEIDDPEGLYYNDDLRQWIRRPNLPEDVRNLLGNLINARRTLNDALEKVAQELRTEPSDYLATLVFDGDDMGKRSREEGVPQKMDEFGRTVFQLLTEGELSDKGVEVVYIGGDEGLLLVPIQYALEIATLIRKKFDKVFNPDGDSPNPFTLSAGLCFFNRQRPMGSAIQMAHAAIEKAKSFPGKDRLGIIVQTASGNEFQCILDWKISLDRVRRAVALICESHTVQLSSGWPYEMEGFLQTLPPPSITPNPWGLDDFVNGVIAEMKRITFRKLNANNIPRERRNEEKEQVWKDKLHGDQWISGSMDEEEFNAITHELHLISFLVREQLYRGVEITIKEGELI